ncbi:SNF2 family N-terminal domain-containing protein, partial [Powellomyces hirtus]
ETKEQLRTLLENVSHTAEVTAKENRLPTPPDLMIELLEHQKIGLEWMLKMEQGTNKGGILADDMGLGKTVTSLALMLSNREPGPKPTLIVCPVSLIYQWRLEIINKVRRGKLRVLVYYGPKREIDCQVIQNFDVVITSYHILANSWPSKPPTLSRMRQGDATDPRAIARMIKWRRIILDEAHIIKNKNTFSAKGACEVDALYRWCLTGTPIQNNIDELYSLLRFLDIRPFCDWYEFRTKISAPYGGRNRNARNKALARVKTLLEAVCLRRNKKGTVDGAPIIVLPEKHSHHDQPTFSESEQEFYTALEHRIQLKFSAYVRAGTVMKNYTNILVLLLRLRQACCHPFLVSKDFDKADEILAKDEERYKKVMAEWPQDVAARLQSLDQDQECVICLDAMTEAVITTCGHLFCKECLTAALTSPNQMEGQRNCPSCRHIIDIAHLVPLSEYKRAHPAQFPATEQGLDYMLFPAKTEPGDAGNAPPVPAVVDRKGKGPAIDPELLQPDALEQPVSSTKIEECVKILEHTRREAPGDKTIVFSQFVQMLDLVEKAIAPRGFKYVRYDGGMSARARDNALSDLAEDPHMTVLLVSLKCGSLGLNLTCANRVVILDPWWNPTVESQAVDRVHRYGQHKPVQVHKITIPGTVEDRILKLQAEKQDLFNAALGENPDAAAAAAPARVERLNLRDLMLLFDVHADQDH